MRLGSTLATLACGLGLILSACASPGQGEETVSEPRIVRMVMDPTATAAYVEVCIQGGSAPRDCWIGRVNFEGAAEGEVLGVQPVLRTAGVRYTYPAVTPSGDALYVTRVTTEGWARRQFRADSQIVRLDLASGAQTVIAEAVGEPLFTGSLLEGEAGRDLVTIHYPTDYTGRGIPFDIRMYTLHVDNGVANPASRRDITDVSPFGYDLELGQAGYLRQVTARGRNRWEGRRFIAVTPQNFDGEPPLFEDLESAIEYVFGCERAACSEPTAARAFGVSNAITLMPRYDTPSFQGLQTEPYQVIANFDERSPTYFPDDNDITGAYLLSFDLPSGRAVAIPRSPSFAASPIAYTLFTGELVPMDSRLSGRIRF